MESSPIQTPSQRFNRISANYAASEIHRDSPTIARLHEFLSGMLVHAVCDVACGAGCLGLSFAGKSKRIVAVDPPPNMLETARQLAAERGVPLETCDAYAESMPLLDGDFDLVGCRVAAHHFVDVRQAIREMARLARPGGRIAIIDLEGQDDPEYDDFNHKLEMLHDPTHVRSYRASEWQQILDSAGLEIETLDSGLKERPAGVTV